MSEEKLPIVYVGPTSSKLGLAQYNYYTELNENIQEALAKYPALNVLFIPLDEFRTRAPSIFSGLEASLTHAAEQLARYEVF